MKSPLLATLLAAGLAATCPATVQDAPATPQEAAPVGQQMQGAFAFNVFRELVAEREGNIVLSPLSLENLLRILQSGATGATRAAFDNLPLGQTGVQSSMQVESADAIFAADDMQLKPTAVKDVQRVNYSLPERAAETINAWCKHKTHGLIPNLVSPDQFDSTTRLVATNAVYLREQWLRPFDTNNTDLNGTFHLADGGKATVALMGQEDKFHYAEGPDWQAVALFYSSAQKPGEPGCFIGILPKGDAREFASTLTVEKYNTIRQALAKSYAEKTRVTLPRMEIRTGTFPLKDALCKNGLDLAFSNQADFSGFADEPLRLSAVLQSCFIKVDEKETVAAAATAGVICLRSAVFTPNYITFDRPFIWVIGDLSTDAAPFFIGLYEKP